MCLINEPCEDNVECTLSLSIATLLSQTDLLAAFRVDVNNAFLAVPRETFIAFSLMVACGTP